MEDIDQLRRERDILLVHLEEARKALAEFDRLRLLACQEVERIAPIARESSLLRWELFLLNTAYNGLQERFDKDQERFAKDRESLAALAGCARDNNWQGVSEGLHAYAWQAFLDAKFGKADQIRRWASLWKRVAKIEHGYGKRLYDEYHDCQEELNLHAKPGGAELQTPKRKDLLRPARVWAAIVQTLERKLQHEREHNLILFAELEGWKSEALAARGLNKDH